MRKPRPRKLKWIEPGHYPKSERALPISAKEPPKSIKVRPAKGRKQKNPHHEEPRPKPVERAPLPPYPEVKKRYVKLKNWVIIDGHRWEHVTTVSPHDAQILANTWNRAGIPYNAVKSGNVVEMYRLWE